MSMPGFWEIAFIAVLALLIFGPDKLPGIARTAGRTIRQFRREAQGALDELKRAADLEELRKVSAELKDTVADIEREAASAGAAATRPYGGTLASGSPGGEGSRAAAGEAGELPGGDGRGPHQGPGPPPFDPDAT